MYTIEKDWITKAGLRAIAARMEAGHLCGYVAIPKEHPLFGVNYSEPTDKITQEMVDNTTLGKKSLLMFIACCKSDNEHTKIRRSLDVLIDVHGGLTFSTRDNDPKYPVEAPNLFWYGFDCNHYNDNPIFQDLPYVEAECESLAEQLQKFNNLA